jgi:putative endonuclease
MTTKNGAREKGRWAERLVARHLRRAGWAIVEANVHARGGEVDLVAWDGDELCFVEVRHRATDRFGTPAATVDARKQRRIVTAASRYIGRMRPPLPRCRFDVVEVRGARGRAEVVVHRGAFEASA